MLWNMIKVSSYVGKNFVYTIENRNAQPSPLRQIIMPLYMLKHCCKYNTAGRTVCDRKLHQEAKLSAINPNIAHSQAILNLALWMLSLRNFLNRPSSLKIECRWSHGHLVYTAPVVHPILGLINLVHSLKK